MGLKVDDIKDVVLQCGSGSDISQRALDIFKKLIQNDRKCQISENKQSPSLWECRWLLDNNDSTQYYNQGDSVWLNTDTEDTILASRKDEISAYVTSHHELNLKYDKINKNDTYEVNNFFKKVINGTACKGVSALYYLGDILQPVQIRVSKKNYNNDYPNTSSWYDFYETTTSAENQQIIRNVLRECLNDQLSSHMDNYHILSVDTSQFSTKYLANNSDIIKERSSKQYFYNHSYFKEMSGFDYVVKQEYDGYNWYKLWSSGYLEQGGYILNDGNDRLRATFILQYNYPHAQNFYQVGYDRYNGINVEGDIDYLKRYCATVTPSVYGSQKPYQNGIFETEGNMTYTCVDIMNMDNNGFDFINVDTNKEVYDGYYYSVCGFRTVTDVLNRNEQENRVIHKVSFYDNLG